MTHLGNLAGRPPLGLKPESRSRKARRPKASSSDAVRASAKGQDCTLLLECCNRDPATTVFAHLRMFGLAGTGQKPADNAGVYACSSCHDAIDRRNGATAGLWGFEDILRALLRTQAQLMAQGLLHLGRLE